jgi:phosphoglycolate phosphatase
MKFDFLIFDLDGTLVDSQKDLASALNLTRKDYCLKPLSVDEVRSYVGNGLKVLVQKAIPEIDENLVLEAVEKLNDHYADCYLDETVPYQGICEMLETLKNAKKAILTNKPERFSRGIVKKMGWDGHFLEIYGGDSMEGIRKPDPRVLFEVMKKIGADPKRTIMIGDGINDVKVAKAGGIASLAVFYGFSDKEAVDSFGADFTAQTPKDILKILAD